MGGIRKRKSKSPLRQAVGTCLHALSLCHAGSGFPRSVHQPRPGKLGSFYRADRVYVLSVAAKDQMLAVLFEWMIGNRTSVQRSFTGQSVDRFPLIKRYLETNAPVLVSRPAAMPRSARSYDREHGVLQSSRSTARTNGR